MCLGVSPFGYNIVIQSNTNKHLNPLDKQFLLSSVAATAARCLFSAYESLHTAHTLYYYYYDYHYDYYYT